MSAYDIIHQVLCHLCKIKIEHIAVIDGTGHLICEKCYSDLMLRLQPAHVGSYNGNHTG